jgi:hypothetical protein
VGFQEGKEVVVDGVVEWEEIFILAIKLGNGIIEDLLRKLNCFEDFEFVGVDSLETWAELFEERFAVGNEGFIHYEFQIRVYEHWPE